jgi:4-amino-4-deoxy-L-arabinose transferase-like glycosyltransferase
MVEFAFDRSTRSGCSGRYSKMTQATLETPPALPAIVEETQHSAEPIPARHLRLRPTRRELWILLAITLLGGVLRFSFPYRPLLWGDDAYTVYRVHAEYQAMLDILQYDGFTPLHYELYWLLGRVTGTQDSPMGAPKVDSPTIPTGPPIVHAVRLTPAVLRFLPAFWGTLMVPAMYLLALHLVRRRTAMVVALVTACSAYLLGYSRDMKMYMMVWCCTTLSAGCLLWWLRTGSRVAWLAWVASSLAMASSHMTGMALLPFEAIFFLTRSNVHWKQSILFVIGLAIIVIPPAGYITQFNRWAQETVEDFGFEVEGIGWVVPYNRGRTGPDLIRYTTSAYLMSWEWPRENEKFETPQWILTTLKAATMLFIALAAIGMLPWSRRLRGVEEGEEVAQPWWRTALWLGLWLIVPTYFLYCRSVVDFASPKVWWDELAAFLAGSAWVGKAGTIRGAFWVTLAVAAAVVGVLVFLFPRFRRSLVWLFPLLAGVGLVVSFLRAGFPEKAPAGAAWVAFVFDPIDQWADRMTDPMVFVGLAVVLPGLVLFYCAPRWRGRAVRVAQFAVVFAALVGCCWLVYEIAHAKFNKEVAEVLEPKLNPPAPAPVVLARHTAGEVERAVSVVETRVWQSIFMPRYMGFIWSAFCIALVALLMRLPTRGVRFAAIGLLVGVNLAQFGGRLFAGTEPPLDRVAHDIWTHDSHNPRADRTTMVFVNDEAVSGPGHPGYGTMSGQQGKYYLGLERGYWIHPSEWKRVSGSQYFDMPSMRGELNYGRIAASLRRSPQVKRVITWEKYFDESAPRPDRLGPLLGSGWTKVDERDYNVRFHWSWADLYDYRRSEYVRK